MWLYYFSCLLKRIFLLCLVNLTLYDRGTVYHNIRRDMLWKHIAHNFFFSIIDFLMCLIIFILLTGLPAWDPSPPTADRALRDPEEKQTPSSPPPPPSPHCRGQPRRPQPGRSWRGDSGLRWSLHDGWGGPRDLPSLPHQSRLWC